MKNKKQLIYLITSLEKLWCCEIWSLPLRAAKLKPADPKTPCIHIVWRSCGWSQSFRRTFQRILFAGWKGMPTYKSTGKLMKVRSIKNIMNPTMNGNKGKPVFFILRDGYSRVPGSLNALVPIFPENTLLLWRRKVVFVLMKLKRKSLPSSDRMFSEPCETEPCRCPRAACHFSSTFFHTLIMAE